VSNERVVRAADAVEDLRTALDEWCDRSGDGVGPLGVRAAANTAIAAVDVALAELHKIRNETIAEARQYDDATVARVDALLGEIKSRPLDWSKTYYCRGCGAVVVGHETCGDPTRPECAADRETKAHPDYKCADCGKTFAVDLTDPMVAHGDYLDHMDEHERADALADPLDPAELAVSPRYPEGTPEYDAYATELRGELQKFAAAEAPYAFESPEVPR
jgi:hypothetical protein